MTPYGCGRDNRRLRPSHPAIIPLRRRHIVPRQRQRVAAAGELDLVIAHAAALERRGRAGEVEGRSEEHTSELQSLIRISYAVLCLKKKTKNNNNQHSNTRIQTQAHKNVTQI